MLTGKRVKPVLTGLGYCLRGKSHIVRLLAPKIPTVIVKCKRVAHLRHQMLVLELSSLLELCFQCCKAIMCGHKTANILLTKG